MAKEFTFGFKIAAALQGNFSAAFGVASNKITDLNSKVKEYAKQMEALNNAYEKGIISTISYNNALANLAPKYDKLLAKQNLFTRQQELQAKLSSAKSSMDDSFTNMLQYAGMAKAMSLPIEKAIDFESAMADVKKVVNFDTPEQFKEMNNDILELSKNIPMTAQGLAQIVAAGGQSGIAREDLISFAESAAKMGVAFDITADEAGEMMAKWRTAFQMNQTQVVELADKINYLGNNTAASAPKISDVVRRIGPLGSIGGIASGEIAALGASMVGAGTESDVAATGIKNLMLGMVVGNQATKTQAEMFDKLGFSTTELAKRMQVDAKGAILDVLSAIQKLPKDEQATTLMGIFGKESAEAIGPLLSNLDNLKRNFDLVADSSNYAGSMQAEFSARADTTANSIELMKNRIDAAQITIGNGLIPVITPMIETVASLASAVGEFATQYPTLTTAIASGVIGFTALSAVTNALLWVFNGSKVAVTGLRLAMVNFNIASKAGTAAIYSLTAAHKISSATFTGTGAVLRQYTGITKSASILTRGWAISQGFLNAAFMANPIGAFIIAATALIGVGYLVYQNWNIVKQFFVGLWESPVAAVLAFIGGPITMLLYTGSVIIANWEAVKSWFTLLWENPKLAISQFVDHIYATFGSAVDWVMEKWNTLKSIFDQPITVTVRKLFLGDDSGTEVSSNANGGIYRKGAFLTTFAEKSGESAIPHVPNRRNIGLLAKTNEIMGNPLGVNTVNIASGGIYGRGAFLTTFAEKSGESAIPHVPNRRNIGLFAKTNEIMGNPLGVNTVNIASNANGGIYGKGAFLTTFAENSGESAIPHAPTKRNIGLLAKTNEIMGNPLGVNTVNIVSNASGGIYGKGVFLTTFAEKSGESAISHIPNRRNIGLLSKTNEIMGNPLGVNTVNIVGNASDSIYGKGVFLTAFTEKSGESAISYTPTKGNIGIFTKTNKVMSNPLGVNTVNIASNAGGGIYGRGAFLTTFAENSGESAIPHTPNRRNIGLLAKTNEIMGSPLGNNTISATFAPQITVQGSGNADELNTLLNQKMQEFEAMLRKLQNQQRRISYA